MGTCLKPSFGNVTNIAILSRTGLTNPTNSLKPRLRKEMENASKAVGCHVVAMPYPGRGHINPLINLCKLISFKNPDILFSFVITEEWHGFLNSYKVPPNLTFQTIPNVLPSELGRAKDYESFHDAMANNMEAPFEELLNRINPVDVIIADTYLGWVVRVGNRRNIPVASCSIMSPSVLSIFYHFDLLEQNGHFPIKLPERGDELVDYIPGIPPTRLADFPTKLEGIVTQKVLSRFVEPVRLLPKVQYLLFTCSYELQPEAVDAFKSELPCPVLTLGPTIPYFELESTDLDDQNVPNYIEWLNLQPEESVLYVSMGSFLSVSHSEMEEIIAGITDSGVRCLWVSRGEKIVFKDDKLRVVVPWCDQLRVLTHPSIGGFWTHCGWNSTLEATYAGVPILAAPIFLDQFLNSKMIVDDWMIGWRVRRGDKGGGSVTRQEIKQLVEDFMNGEKSEVIEMRRRAKQLKEVCRSATNKGRSSDINLEHFISHILRSKNEAPIA